MFKCINTGKLSVRTAEEKMTGKCKWFRDSSRKILEKKQQGVDLWKSSLVSL